MCKIRWAKVTEVIAEAAHNIAVLKLQLLLATCADSALMTVFRTHLEMS